MLNMSSIGYYDTMFVTALPHETIFSRMVTAVVSPINLELSPLRGDMYGIYQGIGATSIHQYLNVVLVV